MQIQDPDLASIAGSVRNSMYTDSPEKLEAPESTPQPNSGAMKTLFGGIGSLFGMGGNTETPGGEDETPGGEDLLETPLPPVEDFPWAKYLIEEDIISKWKEVDMKQVNNLLRNFDVE